MHTLTNVIWCHRTTTHSDILITALHSQTRGTQSLEAVQEPVTSLDTCPKQVKINSSASTTVSLRVTATGVFRYTYQSCVQILVSLDMHINVVYTHLSDVSAINGRCY